jgi:crotonobetainyl-CoA:carnitine CoA-transferase CaiB-like acyl-CoA transferase
MAGPLTGIRVLDIATVISAPLTAQILGDFGADVIKVEHPKTADVMRGHGPKVDGHAIWWKEIARNKRTVAINLSDPEGAEVLLKLVESADVLIENFRPGTLDRWGLGWETLKSRNPGLVVLRVTGFGQTGPYSGRAAFGTLVEAMSGFAALTGEPDGPPALPAFGLADSITGIAGAGAVAMALFHRDARGGAGQEIDLTLLEPIMLAVGPGPTWFEKTGELQARHGNRGGASAPRNLYKTRDGKWLAVSTSATTIAARVMTLVGRPEMTTEPWFETATGRWEHVEDIDSSVAAWIGERDKDDVIRLFTEAGAAIAAVYDSSDLVHDEQVQALKMLTPVKDEDLGELMQHNVLFRMSETPGEIRHTGRPVAADTDEVLADVGLDAEHIAKLRDQGIVR